MMRIVFFNFISILVLALKRLPGVEKLGAGYDIMKGNPHGNKKDEGFRIVNVLEILYPSDKGEAPQNAAGDAEIEVPSNVNMRTMANSCTNDFNTHTYSGVSDFQKSLEASVEISGTAFGAKFGASTDWKNIEQSTRDMGKVVTETVCECTVYEAAFNIQSSHPKVTDISQKAFEKLPDDPLDEENKQEYFQFFDQIGTHVVTGFSLGGRFGVRLESTKGQYSKLLGSKMKGKVEIGAEAGLFGGSLNPSAGTDTQTKRDIQNFYSSQKVFSVGGAFNTDPVAWAATLKDSPEPVHLTLHPVTDFMNENYISMDYYVDPAQLTQKRENLNSAMLIYCAEISGIPNCNPPPIAETLPEPDYGDWLLEAPVRVRTVVQHGPEQFLGAVSTGAVLGRWVVGLSPKDEGEGLEHWIFAQHDGFYTIALEKPPWAIRTFLSYEFSSQSTAGDKRFKGAPGLVKNDEATGQQRFILYPDKPGQDHYVIQSLKFAYKKGSTFLAAESYEPDDPISICGMEFGSASDCVAMKAVFRTAGSDTIEDVWKDPGYKHMWWKIELVEDHVSASKTKKNQNFLPSHIQRFFWIMCLILLPFFILNCYSRRNRNVFNLKLVDSEEVYIVDDEVYLTYQSLGNDFS